MQTHSFAYVRPQNLAQALRTLQEYGSRAKVLAGGQSLIPLMKLRLAKPRVLVDINRIEGLSYIEEKGDRLRIGAMTRHRDLELSKLTRTRYPILAEAAASLADPQIRNLGTVGGALAHADPASDWGAVFLAFETELVAKRGQGSRTIPVDKFFKDTFETALRPTELLTEIRIPKAVPRSGAAYLKLKRKTGDFATVGIAAHLRLDGKGLVSQARIGLAAVGPTSLRSRAAEEALLGQKPADKALREAARRAAEEADPTGDLRGSAEFKRAMVEVFTRRALETALERAGR